LVWSSEVFITVPPSPLMAFKYLIRRDFAHEHE
jgi:hypothetical protein